MSQVTMVERGDYQCIDRLHHTIVASNEARYTMAFAKAFA